MVQGQALGAGNGMARVGASDYILVVEDREDVRLLNCLRTI
jgi:hypothetical protein